MTNHGEYMKMPLSSIPFRFFYFIFLCIYKKRTGQLLGAIGSAYTFGFLKIIIYKTIYSLQYSLMMGFGTGLEHLISFF